MGRQYGEEYSSTKSLCAWADWLDRGGAASFSPGSAINKNGTLEVFVCDPSGHLKHEAQSSAGGAWGDWLDRGGSISSPPIVGCNTNGTLEAFAIGTNGHLEHIAQKTPSGDWGDWLDRGGNFVNFALDTNWDGRLEIIAATHDGEVMHAWQLRPSGAWSDWSSFGTPVPAIPSTGLTADLAPSCVPKPSATPSPSPVPSRSRNYDPHVHKPEDMQRVLDQMDIDEGRVKVPPPDRDTSGDAPTN